MQKSNLKVIDFINKNENWLELLSNPPYSLKIKQDQCYYILTYDMLEGSDMSLELVQECRGLIIKEEHSYNFETNSDDIVYRAVCVPFYKFFNYGEPYAHKLNSDIRVLEKLDGSLIKLWYDNGWNISTNGSIFANNAGMQFQTKEYRTYLDLFYSAWDNSNGSYDKLERHCTYMFELVSPYNRVVVPHIETRLYHIGTRCNISLQELEVDIGIEKPEIYDFNKINDVIKAANDLPYSDEGYVVVDSNYNRVKIKSPEYVLKHYLRSQFNAINYRIILEAILNNEHDDILAIFPEYRQYFDKVLDSYNNYIDIVRKDILMMDTILESICDAMYLNDITSPEDKRKMFASWAKECVNPGLMFRCYNYGSEDWVNQYLVIRNEHGGIDKSVLNNILKLIGLKSDNNES